MAVVAPAVVTPAACCAVKNAAAGGAVNSSTYAAGAALDCAATRCGVMNAPLSKINKVSKARHERRIIDESAFTIPRREKVIR